MKKVLLFLGVILICVFLISKCNQCSDRQINEEFIEQTSLNDNNINTDVSKKIQNVIIGGVEFKCISCDENYARIVCDSMILDTSILNSVVFKMKIKCSPVYFHIPTLTESGEEFASAFDGRTMIYDYPPKNKSDVNINLMALKLANEISSCKLILKNNSYSVDEVNTTIQLLGESSEIFKKSATFVDTKRIVDLRKKLKQNLISAQIKAYPKFRKAYVIALKEKLWPQNVTVEYNNRSITLIGALFANNQNKQDMCNTMEPVLRKYRFNNVYFKWFKYDDDGAGWTFHSPADGVIE